MIKIFLTVLFFFAVSCSKKDDNSVANRFEVTDVVTKNINAYFFTPLVCVGLKPNGEKKVLDQRLQVGQVFSEQSSIREYNKIYTEVERFSRRIESVNHVENSYVFRMDLEQKGNSGWMRGKREFIFEDTFGGSETTFFDASANYRPLLEELKKEKEGVELPKKSYTSTRCEVKMDKDVVISQEVHLGFYVFTSGRKAPASRATQKTKGQVVCMTYEHKDGGIESSVIHERDMGQGQVVETFITSHEVPNFDGCAEAPTEIMTSREVFGETGKVIEFDKDQLTNASY